MLEFYFSYRGVLKRLRSGALGAEMDRIASYFSSLGYKRASAKIYLSRIARFGRFAAEHCRSGPISEGIVDGYLGTFTTDPARIGRCQHFNTRGEWRPNDSLLPHPVWSMIQAPRS
jgi:hypothetical protein